MNPFEFVNSINFTKKDIMEDESDYNPFMINRALSYFPDTLFFAAEMNSYYQVLDNRLQYDFLRHIIRKRKRFSKWFKTEKISDIEVLKEYYGYSTDKARTAYSILSKEQMKIIRNRMLKDGK